jgi:NitT/TauT family transport system substrate-binding protein
VEEKPEVVEKMLRALVQAEEFAREHPQQAITIASEALGIAESDLAVIWPEVDLRVSLDQALLGYLEDEARWMIRNKLTSQTAVPNYMKMLCPDGLNAVKPEAMTVIY